MSHRYILSKSVEAWLQCKIICKMLEGATGTDTCGSCLQRELKDKCLSSFCKKFGSEIKLTVNANEKKICDNANIVNKGRC